ncbi:NUDIX hydrolase family protein [Nocardioides sp. AN3]
MTMEAFGEEFGEESSRWELPEDTEPGWMTEEQLAEARGRVPMLYVEALPVRVDPDGRVASVGLLLRGSPTTGRITRSLVSGRVMHGERIRDALMRHLEKDLGSTAFPVLPVSTVPAAVAEYFPWPDRLHDPRQHAVALAFVVPVSGECQPRQDALEITWLTPEEAVAAEVAGDMEGGRGSLLRQLLHHAGAL